MKYKRTNFGFDFGTANTSVVTSIAKSVVTEPTTVALDLEGRKVSGVGHQAYYLTEQDSEKLTLVRPVKRGIVQDRRLAELYLRYFMDQANSWWSTLFRPAAVLSVPTSSNSAQRRAVFESAVRAGAKDVYIVDAPLLACYGLNLSDPTKFIVDMGYEVTDCAVISREQIVIGGTLDLGSRDLVDNIVEYVRTNKQVSLSEEVAEQILLNVGAVINISDPKVMRVVGRKLHGGMPEEISISSDQVRRALRSEISRLLVFIEGVIKDIPPALLSDIYQEGIYLLGGGAYLEGLDELMSRRLNLKVTIPDSPEMIVAKGLQAFLDQI